MDKLTRNQVSIVLQARTRLVKVKGNYKKKKGTSYTEDANRDGSTATHTRRTHITTSRLVNKSHKGDIFKEDVYHLKEIANKLHNTMDKLIPIKT